jgi:hypothetical protein
MTIMQLNIVPSTSKTNPCLPFLASNTKNDIPFFNNSHASSNLNFNVTNQINSIPSTPNTLENEKRCKQYIHRKDEPNKNRWATRSKKKHLSMEFPVEPTQHQYLSHIAQTFHTHIDAFSKTHTYNTCMESYPRIHTTISPNGFICFHFCNETNGHLFS